VSSPPCTLKSCSSATHRCTRAALLTAAAWRARDRVLQKPGGGGRVRGVCARAVRPGGSPYLHGCEDARAGRSLLGGAGPRAHGGGEGQRRRVQLQRRHAVRVGNRLPRRGAGRESRTTGSSTQSGGPQSHAPPQRTLKVTSAPMNLRLSPTSTTLASAAQWFLIASSTATGATFSPPARARVRV